ncbi:hypothetical protein DBR28_16400, partial [Chryseobacterium sp. HMWF028]
SNGILSLGDTFFLDDLILSTPQNDRKKLLQDGFMKNNYKWLEILFNKSKGMMLKNNDATMTEIVPLFKGIASWVSTYYQQLNVPVTMETMIDIGPTGFNSYDYPKASVNPILLGTSEDKTSYDLYDGYATSHLGLGFIKLENGKISFSQDYLKKIKGTYIGLPGSDTRQDHSESFAMQVNPFEPVIMKSARSYPFLDIPNGEAAVPAFLAASYQQLILDKGADQSIRSLGNGIAIAAAIIAIPETGGGSYVTYLTLVGGAVAGADEKIQSEWNTLSYDQAQNSQYKAYYNAWETFYGAYALVEGGTGIYSLANNLRKINFIKSTKNFYNQMKDFGKNGELMTVWNGLKGIQATTTEPLTFLARLENLNLTGLKSQFDLLDATTKNRLLVTFGKASDDVLKELDDVTSFPEDYTAFSALWKNTSEVELITIGNDINKFKSWWYPNRAKIIDELFVNQKAFENSLNQQFTNLDKLSSRIRGEAWNYYKQQQWSKLEGLYKQYNINLQITPTGSRIIWPPANGGYGLTKHTLKAGDKYDRYGGVLKMEDGVPILTGNFTSPVLNGVPYTFAQRALNLLESEYDVKYTIEILKNLPFDGETSTIIPWFNQKGLGKQTKWNIPREAGSHPKSLTQLAEEGYIKITIEKSPNGKFNNLVNKIISKKLDFSSMDLPAAFQHIKIRDVSTPRKNGIGGCHDATEFAKIRQVNAINNLN